MIFKKLIKMMDLIMDLEYLIMKYILHMEIKKDIQNLRCSIR